MPSVTTLLTDPESFFGARREDHSLRGPAALLGLIAVINLVAAYFQFQVFSELFSNMGGPGSGFAQAIQAVSLVFGLVGPYVGWVIYAGVFHAISVVFDGDGSFTRTMALVGWGYLPSVFGSLAAAAINFYRFTVEGVTVPADPSPEAIQGFTQQITTGPLVAMSAALGMVFTLWSAFLWAFAMKHARELTLREGALTVTLPVLVGLGFSAWSLLTALQVL